MDPYRKSVLAAIVFLLAPLVTVPAMGQPGNAGFTAILNSRTKCNGSMQTGFARLCQSL